MGLDLSKPFFIFRNMILEKFILFRNKRLPKTHVFKSDFPYDEHFHQLEFDNHKFSINAIHLKAKQPKGLVFFLHGTLKHIQYHIPLCYEFLQNHYDVYLLDYPTYGKSTGKINEAFLYQIVHQVYIESLKNEHSKKINYEKKIIIGRSLGTALASHLATKVKADELVLITPYYNMPDLIGHLLKRKKPAKLKTYLPNHEYIPNVKIPITIFHGTKDRLIPHSIAEKLKQHLKPNDSFITLSNSTHFNVHLHDDYKKKIKNILS